MRFTVAWANVVSENLALKISLVCLTASLIAVSGLAIKLATRKPLVIERACYSRMVLTVNGERTPGEVEIFVREALALRFDTAAQMTPGIFSMDEEAFRVQEQQELKKRDLSQRIIINHITIEGEKVTVDADRLFSIGAVRSVLPLPLLLTLGTVARTEWNPYGLTVIEVSAPTAGQRQPGAGK